MLARFAFMTRAHSVRVGPLVTRSMIPMRSFLMVDPFDDPLLTRMNDEYKKMF
jgi:hypothetical protein